METNHTLIEIMATQYSHCVRFDVETHNLLIPHTVHMIEYLNHYFWLSVANPRVPNCGVRNKEEHEYF